MLDMTFLCEFSVQGVALYHSKFFALLRKSTKYWHKFPEGTHAINQEILSGRKSAHSFSLTSLLLPVEEIKKPTLPTT
jgi:hypothetical protein